MFLIGSGNNIIVSVPNDLDQLIKDLNEQKKFAEK